MKKIYYLICVFALAGCSKKDSEKLLLPEKATITYTYTANVSTEYNLFYTDSIGGKQYIVLNGTVWSKTFTIKSTTNYVAGFGLTCTYPFVATTGDLKILLNGQVKADSVYKFDSNGILHLGTVTYQFKD